MPAVTESYHKRSNEQAMTRPWKHWRLALCWLIAQAVADAYFYSAYWADLQSAEDARQQILA